jgi:serine phosphatase RsbU (regulator of sigma subunit)
MKIRLKTIIILSYIFIILIFFFGITFIVNNYILDALTKKHIQYTENSIEELTEQNKALAKQALRAVSCDFVNLYVKDAAKMLASIIKDIKYNNPTELRTHKKLHKLISQPIKYKNVEIGYSALTSGDGLVLIDPNPRIEGKLLSVWKEKFPAMWQLFQGAVKHGQSSGYYSFWATKGNIVEKKYISIVNIPQTKLYICSYVDFSVICDPINDEFNKLKREHSVAIRSNIENHALVLSRLVQRVSLIFIIFLSFLCILFALFIANRISRPIMQLNIAAKKLGKGDFAAAIETKGSLEIFELATTFNELGGQLVSYMENLKNEISAREALEAELKIARNIQMSILQDNSLQDPRDELSLFATLYPAKEVAGDFYDFFYLDEDKRETLVVLMADVSGKGIYAAIFMAMAKTVIKNLCQSYPDSPTEVLQRANNLYLNSESMFVTMFLGYYNIAKGEMLYANGGHHSAIHIGKDNEYKEFGVFNDPLLGLFADNIYHVGKEQFAVGDTLFLYTDGLTEAINDKQEPFGEDRLKKELLNNVNLPLDEVCSNIFSVVGEFEQGNRFDDITMLMLRREGGEEVRS